MIKEGSLFLLAGVLFLAGCGPTIIPNARFSVDLAARLNEKEIVARLDRVLHDNGFKWEDNPSLTSHVHTYTWYRFKPVPGRLPHNVMVLIYPEQPDQVIIAWVNDYAEPFDEDDWRHFYQLRDEIVPKVLRGNVTTTRHPAYFTNVELLAKLSKVFPDPLPEEAKERLAAFEKKSQ